jgi:hypothetical protein
MKKCVILVLLFASVGEVFAGGVGGVQVGRIRVHDNGNALINVTGHQPPGTCSNWGEYFMFNHTTDAGKSLLSTLLSARMAGKSVFIWYTDSAYAGNTEASSPPCDETNLAVITGVAIE